MSEIKNRNLKALERFDPLFCKELLSHEDDYKHDCRLIEGQNVTLAVDGIQLTSRHDRKNCAKYRCRNLDIHHDIHVFGLALGDEIRYIQKELERLNAADTKITVHILCPGVFCALLDIDDELYTLFKKNIIFTIKDFKDEIPDNSVISINELRMEGNFQNALKQRLINYLEREYAQDLFERTGGIEIKKKLEQNSELLKNEVPLKLDRLPKIKKVLILASGPSLGENLFKIKQRIKNGFTLIAADTALGFLEDHNIHPDYIVTIDAKVGKHAGIKFLKNKKDYQNTTLIYAPWSDSRFWLDYPGQRFFLSAKRAELILPFLKEKKADSLWYSGSVAHAQIALAVSLGASKIELLGVDLAFDDEYSHAGIKITDDPYLAKINDKHPVETICNDGRLRVTQRNFTVYKEDLERYIEAHPDILFISLSEKAAMIRGCSFSKE